MSESCVRAKFTAIYESLPEDARRELVEQQLLPLIDGLSSVGMISLLSAAEGAHARYASMPRLDLDAKTAEVQALFDELKRDSFRNPANSAREEITEEIIDSLISWLSDIWQVTYEYGIDFEKAHECLLFSSRSLYQVNTIGSGCKCGFLDMYIPVTIKDRCGKTVKHLSYPAGPLLEDAFLWIWRDMILKMLAGGKTRDVMRIPQMLRDIQSVNNDWTSLDRMLVAGGALPSGDDDMDYQEEDEDNDYVHCPSHAVHWPADFLCQLPALRHYVSDALFDTFKLTPSQLIYDCIIRLTPISITPLLAHLRIAAASSGAAAAAALHIHTQNDDASSVLHVLDVARPVFRPRDAPAMQRAVHYLSHTRHVTTALEIVTRELRDCVEVMRGIIASAAFGGVDKPESREQLTEIMKLRVNSNQRHQRVERWVNSVATGPPPSGNPFTFAAFLMGFPPGVEAEDADESDPLLFSGIKETDAEYETLRDEWRPPLKERFDGWVREAELIRPGGPALLAQIATVLGETMPYTCGSDIVDEMIARIQDKPTKYHICDALDALSMFMKTQKRKKVLVAKNKGKKAATGANGSENAGAKSGSKVCSSQPSGSVTGLSTSAHAESSFSDDMPGLEALD